MSDDDTQGAIKEIKPAGRGGARPGAGRPRRFGEEGSPLRYLVDLMNNEQILDAGRRDRAALAALPYCHTPRTGAAGKIIPAPENEDDGTPDDHAGN